MKYNKIFSLLAIIGTLLTSAVKGQSTDRISPNLGIFAAAEQETTPASYFGVNIQPELTLERDIGKLGYYGSFYREEKDPGSDKDWATIVSKIQAENEDWALEFGRSNTRKYAGHLCTPTTSSFDNKGVGKGTTRNYTGLILTHQETGLSLGQVASDGNLKLSHLDQTLLGLAKELSEKWAIQLQLAGDKDGIARAGATLRWQPTDTTTLATEGFYKGHETTALLTANHKLTDNLTLFGGAQMSWEDSQESTGLLTAGASYDFGHGFTAVTAAQQTLGSDSTTTALVGVKYSGKLR